MAPRSSTLDWKIPWMEEPGRLQSMGLRRVGHNWATSLSLFTFMHWRRKWQPTPVFLPGESQGRGSLVDCRLWGRTESGTTEVTVAAAAAAAADSWDAYEKNYISYSETLASSHRKVLNFLRYLAFFNSQNYFWCSYYLPLLRTSI